MRKGIIVIRKNRQRSILCWTMGYLYKCWQYFYRLAVSAKNQLFVIYNMIKGTIKVVNVHWILR